MGCSESKPAPTETQTASTVKNVDADEMAAIKAKLAENADKGGYKKDKTFRRKFDGYKVGGGSKHNVHRGGLSAEEKAEADAINAKLREKEARKRKDDKAEKEAKEAKKGGRR